MQGVSRITLAMSQTGPALWLDFLSGILDPRITFSRGSQATVVDSTGKITYAPNNLLTYSEQFDNAAWVKTAVAAAADSTTAPNGITSADTLTADGTASPHNIRQTGVVAGFSRILSVYAKAGTNNFVQLYFDTDSAPFANFDLSTGAVGTTGSNQTASITSLGNGWYRCAIYSASTTATTPRIGIISSASAARAESNSLNTSIYIWGAQLEAVTYQTSPSAYTATTSAAYYGPRFDYDPVTLAAKGLLIEEQRSNLQIYSNPIAAQWSLIAGSLTDNSIASPDGRTNAGLWSSDGTSATHRLNATTGFSATNAVTYTAAIYLKAGTLRYVQLTFGGGTFGGTAYVNFDLQTGAIAASGGSPTAYTITNAGNGWWRCTLTDVAVATATGSLLVYALVTGSEARNPTTTASGTIYTYQLDVQVGSFITSSIPTVASTATRSADVATMTGANFSAWWSATEGTFIASSRDPGSGTRTIVAADDNSANNAIRLYSSTLDPKFIVVNGGVTQADIDAGSITANTSFKLAGAYAANNFAASVGGGAAVTDTSGTLPTVDRLRIGTDQAGNYLNGNIASIAYYNRRLPDATLAALTT